MFGCEGQIDERLKELDKHDKISESSEMSPTGVLTRGGLLFEWSREVAFPLVDGRLRLYRDFFFFK